MYKIVMDGRRETVEITLGGMMSLDEVAEYIAELRRQFIIHHLRSYLMLIDVSDMPIQAQDTIVAMGQHMATMPKARSIAIVTGKSLARMQIRRLFKQPYARIAATMAEGRAWILDGKEPQTL